MELWSGELYCATALPMLMMLMLLMDDKALDSYYGPGPRGPSSSLRGTTTPVLNLDMVTEHKASPCLSARLSQTTYQQIPGI